MYMSNYQVLEKRKHLSMELMRVSHVQYIHEDYGLGRQRLQT
jgi:hypothetical protein